MALLFIKTLAAQQPGNPAALPADKIDGLILVLKKAREDTNKVNILQELYFAYTTNKNYSEAVKYNNEALPLAKNLDIKRAKPDAW